MEFVSDSTSLRPVMPLFSRYAHPFTMDFYCPGCKVELTFEFFGAWATVLLETMNCPVCKYKYIKMESL